MEIHFCDLCNESVPQADLDLGRAQRRKGHVVCAKCELAMSTGGAGTLALTSPPAQERAAALGLGSSMQGTSASAQGQSQGLTVFLWAGALVLSASVGVLLSQRMDTLETGLDKERATLLSELTSTDEGLRAELGVLKAASSEQIRQALEELTLERARNEQRAGELRADIAKLSTSIDELAQFQRGLWNLPDVLARSSDDLRLAQAQLADLRDALTALDARVRTPLLPLAPAEPAAQAPTWLAEVERLKSASAGERWSAVQRLGELGLAGERQVIAYLLPELLDADLFVRMATARLLGDLKAVEAVPGLIDALEDAEPSVREAGLASLQRLTGRDFGFDPLADDAERAKRVKAWREWWKKSGAEFLGS